MQFSEALTHLMESNGVTAYRLFKDTGIAQSIIGRWKAGKASPSAEYLQEVANYFNVSTDYLLGSEKESPADELDEAKRRLMDVVRTLNNDDLDKVLDYAKLLEAARPKKTKS